MIQNIPDRQSLSYNSFFHLSLRNWMIPARKTNDKLILKLLTSWPCMFSGEWWWGRCHLKQLCWQSHWLSTFKSFHCAALPYAFIICDKYIFIVSTLVWHCRVPCQSLICLEHDIKLIWRLSRYHLQFVSPGTPPQIFYPHSLCWKPCQIFW